MPSTLDQLIARGFKFVTVSELLAMDKPLPPKPPGAPLEKSGTPKPYAPTADTAAPTATTR